MISPYFQAATLDDLMRSVFEAILAHGEQIRASKGAAKELTGTLIELTNPRARLSRTETRGKPFSCLGELCWYLAKNGEQKFISYYMPNYKTAEGEEIYGAYGPRLFQRNGLDQVANVIDLLRRKRTSRRAVIQLFDATDLLGVHEEIPCTCTLQFMIRADRLQLFTSMRSNDAYLGLPHDIFSFTMLQEIVARSLSVELGTYKHAVGSLHVYDEKLEEAEQYLREGWQPTTMPMPPMPTDDPWISITSLLNAERVLREGRSLADTQVEELDPYWADLVRLLRVLRSAKDKDWGEIEALRDSMSSEVYRPFIERRIPPP